MKTIRGTPKAGKNQLGKKMTAGVGGGNGEKK